MLRMLDVSNKVPIKMRVEKGSESNNFFNRFFTFQVDRDVRMLNEGVEMVIPPFSAPTAFKLTAWFNSAFTSH